ncbi:DUF4175 domain-containing protein, partial [Escherichia coli]|nr:DUF4175 domain-containing protein [Escherichia coli]
QERLSEAMRNGANDDEIAALMQELREAMQDYIRQLAEQQQSDDQQLSEMGPNTQMMTADQLQQMMDRIQELMEEGRMAEAQMLMDQLMQMMQNMQLAQVQGGQGPEGQAMQGLSNTLRDQQQLSDEAFGQLQDRFNPNGRPGEGSQQQGDRPGEGSLADQQQALRDQL